jgi:hypothetical protein
VSSGIGRGCGGGIAPTKLQDAATARLAYVGITVSNVHNATLSMDLDCRPVTPGGNPLRAVEECLTFSEFVSAPSKDGKPTLASTWHKCRSYSCDRKCEESKHYTAQLVGEFLGDLWERSPVSPNPAPVMAPSTAAQEKGPGTTVRVAIFGGYILNCISVLVYWQLRNRVW